MIKRLILAVGVLLALSGVAGAFLIAGNPISASLTLLGNGTYLISSGANSVDGGQSSTPWVALAATDSTTDQQWSWNGSKLNNIMVSQSATTVFDTGRNTSGQVTLTSANSIATKTSGNLSPSKAFTSPTHSTGKYVFRFTAGTLGNPGGESTAVGLANSTDVSNAEYLGQGTNSFGFFDNGNVYINNSVVSSTGLSFVTGNVIDVVVDLTNDLAWFRVNSGAWRGFGPGAADPTAGTNGLNVSAVTGTNFSPAISFSTVNDQFTSSAPPVVSGALAWSTSAGAPGPFMADNDASLATENATGDAWTIFVSGAGYKVRNNRTNNYLAIVTGALAMSSSEQTIWDFVPLLTMTVTPPSPSIPSSTALGGTVATMAATWSNSATYAGSFMFVAPNYDADTYSINGSNLTVAPDGPGVGSVVGTQNVTVEAVQMDTITADNVVSNAPSGAPLKTTGSLWSWGPVQSGRAIGGGAYAGDNVLYRNGAQVGSGSQMTVDNGGQFYVFNTSPAQWYRWNGSSFVTSAAP